MRPESRKLVWDAREAVAKVQEFTAGKTLEDYNAERLLSSAVERQLEILGEARHRLSRTDPEAAASIDEISSIRLSSIISAGSGAALQFLARSSLEEARA